jgi:ribosomal-protein-alanine N-acetyltransferase
MVRIEPASRAWLDALLVGDATFTNRFGIEVVDGWTAEFTGITKWALAQLDAGADPAWGIHLFFDDDVDGALVGNGGWKGPPIDGAAELGYAVSESRRGRGIATSVVRQLLEQARDRGLARVIADTLPETSASTTVLRRCGFVRAGEVVDPEEGVVWRWDASIVPSGADV